MKTIKDVFEAYRRGLDSLYSTSETEAITLLAINEITGLSKAKIKAFPDDHITQQQADRMHEILAELATGRPLQYIIGHTEFYGLPFNVNPSVLIPRPETEELVEWILSTVKAQGLTKGDILDIGTGSGCIAISLKKHLSGFEITGIDVSKGALSVAKENAAINRVDVLFTETDILNTGASVKLPQFDIIVSNPPYVTLVDKAQMHKNVTDFEPHTALFVPENDPLIFYREIAELAVGKLKPSGLLFFEINESYGAEVVELLQLQGFKEIVLRKDLSGRDRMAKGTKW